MDLGGYAGLDATEATKGPEAALASGQDRNSDGCLQYRARINIRSIFRTYESDEKKSGITAYKIPGYHTRRLVT